MAFRVIFIESDAVLKSKLDNLLVMVNEQETWIPLTDISMIVLDNLRTSMTSRLLCTLAKENIALVICDQQHLPIGFYSCYDNHSRSSKIIGSQIQVETTIIGEFWRNVVIAKIENQRKVITILERSDESHNKLDAYIKEVMPNDVTNREAHAAKVYFNQLMGKSFSRGDDNILLNSGLNYGYTIMRSYISRLCVGYGLNTQIGIHHHNEYNRFNLVDDLIEPFRPIVDLFVYRLLEGEEYFKSTHREKIVNILNHKIIYKAKRQYLCNAIETYIYSISKGFNDQSFEHIEFPDIDNYVEEVE